MAQGMIADERKRQAYAVYEIQPFHECKCMKASPSECREEMRWSQSEGSYIDDERPECRCHMYKTQC